MTDAVARVRFSWDSTFKICRAAAYDVNDNLLGQIAVELPDDTLMKIRTQRGPNAQLRVEEIVERQLRLLLELRY